MSNLSPYVRYRLLSEREIVAAVLQEHAGAAADKFVQEVLWRTYWKGWLELRPTIWTRFVVERDATPKTGGMAKAIAAAEEGRTGIDGFDDWAHELVERGYLHNHARMWFASIWIFTLGLPWVHGADFFLRHLVDADPASNTLSWRWVAGLQTPGKTYLATADNIGRNTNGRFAPRGLATRAVALTEAMPVPAPTRLAPMAAYDPRQPALLLVTAEDMSAETLFAPDAAIRRVVGVDGQSDWPWGYDARAFVSTGVGDAAARAATRFGCPSTRLATLDPGALIAATHEAGAQSIITAFAPVGPIATALADITPELEAAGVPLVQVRRDWDTRFWPHATKGFFPFRERIPALLAEEGLRG